ncbi:MAG: hypothetical protein ABIB43_05405 [archaeon]
MKRTAASSITEIKYNNKYSCHGSPNETQGIRNNPKKIIIKLLLTENSNACSCINTFFEITCAIDNNIADINT